MHSKKIGDVVIIVKENGHIVVVRITDILPNNQYNGENVVSTGVPDNYVFTDDDLLGENHQEVVNCFKRWISDLE
ncbi:hypothetical protein [Serratia nevei]|uniref:hypothetical protein n=1 Tax=Serratia nevei TaxID=2703794 RepID=UPI0036D17286